MDGYAAWLESVERGVAGLPAEPSTESLVEIQPSAMLSMTEKYFRERSGSAASVASVPALPSVDNSQTLHLSKAGAKLYSEGYRKRYQEMNAPAPEPAPEAPASPSRGTPRTAGKAATSASPKSASGSPDRKKRDMVSAGEIVERYQKRLSPIKRSAPGQLRGQPSSGSPGGSSRGPSPGPLFIPEAHRRSRSPASATSGGAPNPTSPLNVTSISRPITPDPAADDFFKGWKRTQARKKHDISFRKDAGPAAAGSPDIVASLEIAHEIPESLIPDEFHVWTSEKLVTEPHQADMYYDESVHEWRSRHFPTLTPAGRHEVHLLRKCYDQLLAQCDPEDLDALERVHRIGLHELIRHVYVHCSERGVLLAEICDQMEARFRTMIARLNARFDGMQATIDRQERHNREFEERHNQTVKDMTEKYEHRILKLNVDNQILRSQVLALKDKLERFDELAQNDQTDKIIKQQALDIEIMSSLLSRVNGYADVLQAQSAPENLAEEMLHKAVDEEAAGDWNMSKQERLARYEGSVNAVGEYFVAREADHQRTVSEWSQKYQRLLNQRPSVHSEVQTEPPVLVHQIVQTYEAERSSAPQQQQQATLAPPTSAAVARLAIESGASTPGRKRALSARSNASSAASYRAAAGSLERLPAGWRRILQMLKTSKRKHPKVSSMPLRNAIRMGKKLVHEKKVADDIDTRERNERQTLPEFAMDYFLKTYGMRKLADKHLVEFLHALWIFQGRCPKAATIGRFLGVVDAHYSLNVLNFFIVAEEKIHESTIGINVVEGLYDDEEDRDFIDHKRAVAVTNLLFRRESAERQRQLMDRLQHLVEQKTCWLATHKGGRVATVARTALVGTPREEAANEQEKVIPLVDRDLFLEYLIAEWQREDAESCAFIEKLFRASDHNGNGTMEIDEFVGCVMYADPTMTDGQSRKIYCEAVAHSEAGTMDLALFQEVCRFHGLGRSAVSGTQMSSNDQRQQAHRNLQDENLAGVVVRWRALVTKIHDAMPGWRKRFDAELISDIDARCEYLSSLLADGHDLETAKILYQILFQTYGSLGK